MAGLSEKATIHLTGNGDFAKRLPSNGRIWCSRGFVFTKSQSINQKEKTNAYDEYQNEMSARLAVRGAGDETNRRSGHASITIGSTAMSG